MKKAKIFLLGLLALALTAVAVFGTLAYLTDSDSTRNTFTVGNVDISLDETDVDENGIAIPGADRVKENAYHLLPGVIYTKDPTITVQPNSADSYIRMVLTVYNASVVQDIINDHGLTDFSDLIGGWDPTVWLYHGFTADDTANTISFEFRYKETVGTQETPVTLPALFQTLIVPGTLNNAELETLYAGGFQLVISGHAIQSASLDTADAAWAVFDEQTKP